MAWRVGFEPTIPLSRDYRSSNPAHYLVMLPPLFIKRTEQDLNLQEASKPHQFSKLARYSISVIGAPILAQPAGFEPA